MFGSSKQLQAQQAHIARLEEEVRGLRGLVERLADSADVGPAELEELRSQLRPAFPPRVDELIAQDQLIAAIKEYRTATGAGRKEAKDAVEARRDGLR